MVETALAVEKEGIKDRGEALAAIGSRTADDRFRFLLAQNLYRRPDGTYAFRFDAEAISAGADSLTGEFPAELSYPGKVLSVPGRSVPVRAGGRPRFAPGAFPPLADGDPSAGGPLAPRRLSGGVLPVVSAFLRQ